MIHGVIFSKDGPIICHSAIELAIANGDFIVMASRKDDIKKLRQSVKKCLSTLIPK